MEKQSQNTELARRKVKVLTSYFLLNFASNLVTKARCKYEHLYNLEYFSRAKLEV